MSGARPGRASSAVLKLPAGVDGVRLAATVTHGVEITVDRLDAPTCAAISAALLAKVAAAPCAVGVETMLDLAERYRVLGMTLATTIGMTPRVSEDD